MTLAGEPRGKLTRKMRKVLQTATYGASKETKIAAIVDADGSVGSGLTFGLMPLAWKKS